MLLVLEANVGRVLLDRCGVDDGRARWALLTNHFLLPQEKVTPVREILEAWLSETQINLSLQAVQNQMASFSPQMIRGEKTSTYLKW